MRKFNIGDLVVCKRLLNGNGEPKTGKAYKVVSVDKESAYSTFRYIGVVCDNKNPRIANGSVPNWGEMCFDFHISHYIKKVLEE